MLSEAGGDGDVYMVFTTVGSREDARALARRLVEARLAACVTAIPVAESIYRWADEIVAEPEVLLVIKTTGAKLRPLQECVAGHHPYEVPEILTLKADACEARYSAWLREATGPPKGEER